MYKRQFQISSFDGPALLAPRWHCVKNRHDSVMKISTWAEEISEITVRTYN